MPLIALDMKSGRRVDVRDFDNVRVEIDCAGLVCPFDDCRAAMVPVRGPQVSAHFRHKVSCTTQYRTSYGTSGESAEHRMGKRFIADDVAKWFKARGEDVAIDYEVAVPEARRIADVMVTRSTGERIAVECQLAAITVQELDERTGDYARAGLSSLWYLGGHAYDQNTSDWCTKRYGGVNRLVFDKVAA